MEHLIAKIRSGELNKCVLTAPMFAHLIETIAKLDHQIDQFDLVADIASLDSQIDELEKMVEDVWCILAGVTNKEHFKLIEELKTDYKDSIKILQQYRLLDREDQSYVADYDGTIEGEEGIDFSGQQFILPTFNQILSRIGPAHLDLLLKMKEEGSKAHLQITPIGYKIATLINHFNTNKDPAIEFTVETSDPFEDFENNLCYDPEVVGTDKTGKEVRIRKGLSKSELIEENQGFLIDIITANSSASSLTSQTEEVESKNYFKKMYDRIRKVGGRPLSFEAFLIEKMRPVENNTSRGRPGSHADEFGEEYMNTNHYDNILLGASPVVRNLLSMALLDYNQKLVLRKEANWGANLETPVRLPYSIRIPPR